MDRLAGDLAYAVRRLARMPAFFAVAVLTLGVAMGANTAIFSLVRAILLRPLPYGDPSALVMLWQPTKLDGPTWLAIPEIASYRKEVTSLQSIAAYGVTSASITGAGDPERVAAALVTRNTFTTLGVAPQLGRGFRDDDDASSVAVLGYDLWQRQYGADPQIIGKRISVNGTPRVVVGVMPASFRLPLDFHEQHPTELWVPLDFAGAALSAWGDHGYFGIARLKAGASLDRVTQQVRAAELGWIRDGFRHDSSMVGRAPVPMRKLVVGDFQTPLVVLIGAVLAVLLIACANVANLQFANADARRQEMSVRIALGASRGALVWQLLAEALIIAGCGAAIGSALAAGGVRLLAALRPGDAQLIQQATIDAPVFLFTLGLAVATCIACGLAPALQASRGDHVEGALRESGHALTVSAGRQRARDALTIAQIAVSIVLLIGATLLLRTLAQLQRVDLGFDAHYVLTAQVTVPRVPYGSDTAVADFYERLLTEVRRLPGVQSAGATRLLPLTGHIGDWSITIEGRVTRPEENPNGDWQVVTPGYLEAMRIPVVRGRSLEATDDARHPLVAIISETMAQRYWPNVDPIGKRFHIGSAERPWITIVGTVGHVRHDELTERSRAEMYLTPAQWAAAGASAPRAMTLVMRAAGDPAPLAALVRRTVHELDPTLPVYDVRTLADVVAGARAEARFVAVLLGAFAGLALLLATVGVYSVIALLVARRRKEIAIRVALGARRSTVVGMVVGRGMRLAAIGVAFGVAGAAATSQTVASLLYGVTRFDPLTFTAVPLLLVATAIAACLVPANRAARIDPVHALRE